MKKLSFKHTAHWLIFTLANVLILFTACSKDSDSDNPAKDPYEGFPTEPVIKQGEKNYISLYSKKQVGEEITIGLQGKKGVWVDLNNNGKQDGDDSLDPVLNSGNNDYYLKSQVFTVYGELTYFRSNNNSSLKAINLSHAPDLTHLHLNDNELTQLDLSKNTALTFVELYYNNFTAQEMLAMAKSLHAKKGGKNITLQSVKGGKTDNNKVDRAVLDELDKKGWTARYYDKKGNSQPYNKNPNAPNKP